MKPLTLVILGIHSSGKTTLGKLLAKHYGWIFHEEIGNKLRLRELSKDRDKNVMISQQNFDDEVFKEEFDRDYAWSRNTKNSRVVETWHIGNLAYAHKRESIISQSYLDNIKNNLENCIIVYLKISKETLGLRLRDEACGQDINSDRQKYIDFLWDVGKNIEKIIKNMNLNISATVMNNNDQKIEFVLKEIIKGINSSKG